jgi:hypothetical protein
MAALRFHIYRINFLPLDAEKKKNGDIIQTVAKNNYFRQSLLHKLNRQIQHKTAHTQTRRNNKNYGLHSPIIALRYEKSPTCSKTPT